ncbi:MAG: hypothetical protein A2534_02555 [Candidatus Magasanikbacteria bacterium RIFOXYD2_FULL_39_9]|uniref:EfeO-type cupredoxin-like domain-containing protein n=1 Tax=Candidatus Magasanikbacteria bacterium RIFOXYD1_FULL_40_23 TaxID=1798705 RepID=A0A1F6P920_9BACT|nr:MAG: hypothetical protein A2563_02840 [Candidatus Magasanikbacteria bacterium RIFOXYD1_FULL_40_23]OGH93072.1 MAG: hypothetical protein A2534_02555 [Candidatus Magasanikbacteria bacterium RIFOXYD2_FULL_39_9]
MKKTFIAIFIFVAAVITGAILFSGGEKDTGPSANNIKIKDGKQIITINAKGGYTPRITNAKADMPTVIKIDTRGTFDCSSSLVIPALNYRKNLPPSGETLVDVPAQKAGTSIRGMCSMGMFSFNINFN